jgi:hypothetical protein
LIPFQFSQQQDEIDEIQAIACQIGAVPTNSGRWRPEPSDHLADRDESARPAQPDREQVEDEQLGAGRTAARKKNGSLTSTARSGASRGRPARGRQHGAGRTAARKKNGGRPE